MTNISGMRTNYPNAPLDEASTDPDPFTQFKHWMQAAIDASHIEPNAMTLATTTLDGKPSARMVLLKGFDHEGFVFFTNYDSRKGSEIAANPHVALCFYWDRLTRQVRIEGTIEKLESSESDAYFESRPRESQLGAWVSEQSSVIASREALTERESHFAEKFAEQKIPRPPYWGGYRVKPQKIEFWQGRPGRLHDRLLYSLEEDGSWTIERLAP